MNTLNENLRGSDNQYEPSCCTNTWFGSQWVFEFLVFTSSRQFWPWSNLYDTTKPERDPLVVKFGICDDQF